MTVVLELLRVWRFQFLSSRLLSIKSLFSWLFVPPNFGSLCLEFVNVWFVGISKAQTSFLFYIYTHASTHMSDMEEELEKGISLFDSPYSI